MPRSARQGRTGANAIVPGLAESGARMVLPLGPGGCVSDVQEVAMTPRSVGGMTPRPVVRGSSSEAGPVGLSEQEGARAERAFRRHDKMQVGEVDTMDFFTICESLDLTIAPDVAADWIGNRQEGQGMNMEEFKQIYARVLAAQSPAVRQVHSSAEPVTVRLDGLTSTEAHMRAAFSRHAPTGQLPVDNLSTVFQYLRFPDHHGDGFDRFVGEWLLLANKDETGSLNFHEFAASVNLLIDFCESQRPQAPASTV